MPYPNKIIKDGTVLIDLTDSTVTPALLMQGVVAYGADGSRLVGEVEDGDPLAYGLSTSPLINVARADSAVITDYAGAEAGRALAGLAVAG